MDIPAIKSHMFFANIDWNTICDTKQKDELDLLKTIRPPHNSPYNTNDTVINTWVAPLQSDELVGYTVNIESFKFNS